MIWIHRYELIPLTRLSSLAGVAPRKGALLRLDDSFADIHPWPELGDASLDEQLARLARGETTPLTAQSMAMAAEDGAARREGRSLFEGLIVPESHWPAAAGPAPPAFDTIKVKMPGSELPERGRLRLDFNATLTAAEFLRLELPVERIDFVEDPCPYETATWKELQRRSGLRLALDREVATEGVDVLVVKPAIQTIPQTELEIVVTSYMDHPVGQLHAAAVAARAVADAKPVSSRCGLVTHLLFEPDAFGARLRLDGARLVPPGGSGIGFDDLLDRLPWMRL